MGDDHSRWDGFLAVRLGEKKSVTAKIHGILRR